MRDIKKYVNDIFKDIIMDRELKLQKSELYDHLVDKVTDLINSGSNEEIAMKKVIHDFGTVNDVRKELELISDDAHIISNIKRINFISYMGIIFSVIGLELFFVILYFFKEKQYAFFLLVLCITVALSLLSYTIFQLSTIKEDNERNNILFHSVKKLNIAIIIINPISLALCLPFLTQVVSLTSYLKVVFVYLILAYLLIHVSIMYFVKMMNSNISLNKKHKLVSKRNSWLKRLLTIYIYIPFLLYVIWFFIRGNDQLLYILLLICIIIQMVYDVMKSHHKQTWFNLHFIRAFVIAIVMSDLVTIPIDYYIPSLNLNNYVGFLYLFLIIILLVLIIIKVINYLRKIKTITNDLFIKQIGLMMSVIVFIISIILILSTHSYSISNDGISFNLNPITTKKMIVFYLSAELFIKLIIRLLLKYHQISPTPLSSKSSIPRYINLTKKRYIVVVLVGFIIFVFLFKLPQYFYYEYNVQTSFKDAYVTNFNYQVYKTDNHDAFVLSSYDLSDGRSCIGYQQYYSSIGHGIFNLFPSTQNYDCDQSVRTQDTISAKHSVTMEHEDYTKKTHHIQLYVFGHNTGEYNEIVITYKWGEVIRIPIDNEPLFFHYKEIEVPSNISMNEVWGEFFVLTKVR